MEVKYSTLPSASNRIGDNSLCKPTIGVAGLLLLRLLDASDVRPGMCEPDIFIRALANTKI